MAKTTFLETLGGFLVSGLFAKNSHASGDEEAEGENHRQELPGGVTLRACPTLRIDLEVYARLRMYVEAVSGEISLLGASDYEPERNEILIKQIYLPEQTCTASSTEISEDGLADALLEATRHGYNLDIWIHSHAEMGTFFSATDQHAIEKSFPQSPRTVSIVVNHAGDMLARFTQNYPVHIELDHLPIRIGVPIEIESAIRQEVKDKVRSGDRWRSIVKYEGPAAKTNEVTHGHE